MWARQSATKQQHGKDAHAAKKEIRLQALAAVPNPTVFDAFCGDGGMFRAAWYRATKYVGCDLRFWPPQQADTRRRFVADNMRVMRAIDLQEYNIFDLDAYGSPWEHMLVLASRRKWAPKEVGAVILTDGTNLKMRFGQLPAAIQQLLAADSNAIGACSANAEIAQAMALRAWAALSGVDISKMWTAEGRGSGKGGSKMVYTAIVVVGK